MARRDEGGEDWERAQAFHAVSLLRRVTRAWRGFVERQLAAWRDDVLAAGQRRYYALRTAIVHWRRWRRALAGDREVRWLLCGDWVVKECGGGPPVELGGR